jgi:RND family efflux transporter MFP subunit
MNNSNIGGSRTKVITVLVTLLVVVTVVVIQMIEKAPRAGAGGHPAGAKPEMPPASVIAVKVGIETTRERVKATGILYAASRSDVAAQEAGVVLSMPVDEGDSVKRGEPLAILDPRRRQAQVDESQARLTAARNLFLQRNAEVTRAESDYEMKQKLRPTNAVSQSSLLDAEKALAVAKSQNNAALEGIAEAESRRKLLEIQFEDLTVKAPFDGIVISRHVEPGEWVASGQTVVTILAVNPVEAWLKVPARYLGNAGQDKEGFKVRQSSTGILFDPETVVPIPDVEPRSQLFTVVATVPNTSGNLTPGESVTGVVPVGKLIPYLKVPTDAIVHSQMGVMVQIVQPPEGGQGLPTGRPTPVNVAFQRDGVAYILADGAGFKEGDQVIVEGNQRLMPGQQLMVKPAPGQTLSGLPEVKPGTPPAK